MFASGAVRSVGKQKIFCVGCNKTGTTSLEVALRELGYIMGDQATAELLTIQYWGKRDFRRIIRYCYTA
jgi:3-oxoacyl-[acyl-carrier-protein] synthase III